MGASVPTGVSQTALFMARIRAEETRRPDRLFDDPYAEAFVAATREALPDDPVGVDEVATPEAEQSARMVQWATSHVVIRTRFFDDYLLSAAADGVDQVVLLAAGLDTRAYRLPWPGGTRVFELDLPELVDFKQGVLAERGARGRCEHHVLATDLRREWAAPLAAAGLRTDRPTAWLVEGLLTYLTARESAALLATIGRLSAAGSRIALEVVAMDDARWQPVFERASSLNFASLIKGGLPDPAGWLAEHGWQAELNQRTEADGWYGRPGNELMRGFVTATHLGPMS